MSDVMRTPNPQEVEELLQHFNVSNIAIPSPSEIEDILQHHGVKGQRWGIIRSAAELARAAGRSLVRGGKNVRKAVLKASDPKARARHKIERLKQKQEIKSLKADLKGKPKRPQDMTDEELRNHMDKTMATQKLIVASKSKALDAEARAQAEVLLKNKDRLSLTEYKIESSRIEQRAKRLEAMLPSNNKKPGVVFNTMVAVAKQATVNTAANALTRYATTKVSEKLGINKLDPSNKEDAAKIAELTRQMNTVMSYANIGIGSAKTAAATQLDQGLRTVYGNIIDNKARARGSW